MIFLKVFCRIRQIRSFFGVAPLLALLFAAGCASSVPPVKVCSDPTPEELRIAARSAELAELLRPLPIRSTMLKLPASPLAPEEATRMLRALQACGFNRLAVTVDRLSAFEEPDEDDALLVLLNAAAECEVPVELVLRQKDFVRQFRGNAFLRLFRSETANLPEAARLAAKFIADQEEAVRPVGVTVVVEPHLFTAGAPGRPQGELFAWSEKSYGTGFDNDHLMATALGELSESVEALSPLPVTAGIADFYQEKAAAGELSCGSVEDFLKITPRIVVYNSGNKPSELLKTVENELAAATEEDSVLVAVTIAPHTAITSGALRRRDWRDLTRAVNYAIEKWQACPAFGGMALGPFPLIELLLAEE